MKKIPKITVMTVVGTRPEIIRLSAVMRELDRETHQVIVHTGQNYDFELNEIFFRDLKLRKPDYFLNAHGDTPAATVGKVIAGIEPIIEKVKPDAFLVLGDTNSCLTAYAAKRHHIPVFHMEAGNRCFDQRVPEEINRRLIDQMSDVNLVYSELARHNLLRENFPADRVIKTGSPMREVLESIMSEVQASSVLTQLKLKPREYFVLSAHREENVGGDRELSDLAASINAVAEQYGQPIIMSVHPRTAARFKARRLKLDPLVKQMKPFGIIDYVALQQQARCVISDSGTLYEEAAILHFPAVNIRQAQERPEAMDEGWAILAGITPERVLQAVALALRHGETSQFRCPADYESNNVSKKVVRIILGYIDYVRRTVWYDQSR